MSHSIAILAAAPTLDDARLPPVSVPGLYVHIPFCFHKCHYCDFYSITGQTPQRMERFVDLILREAARWTPVNGPLVRPRTVFFGGGTPSLLPREQMQRLIAGLRQAFDFSLCDEFTVEANPATVDAEYCHMLRESGVNRISFGAQSFDRAELAVLERHHDPEDVPRSVETARRAGFERINVDLIYAICGQNLQSWGRSLESAIALGTRHLSCYGLTYEPNTTLAVKKRLGRVQAVEPDLELEMLTHTRERLSAAGMPAYEISNFAALGEECRHNLLYWTGGDYIGLGPSAASHVQGWRWKNKGHLGKWENAAEAGGSVLSEMEHLSTRRRCGEMAMLTLRLARGLNYAEFAHKFEVDARMLFADVIERYSGLGFLKGDAAGVCLTERGIKVADSLAAEFLLEDES